MEKPSLFELKKKLITEDDFSSMWEFFLDHFGEDDEFLARGHKVPPADFPITKVAVAAALATMYSEVDLRGTTKFADIQPIHIPEEQFLHGAIHLGTTFGVFLYFEDVDVGLVYVYAGDDLSKFARISPTSAVRRQKYLKKYFCRRFCF